MSLGTDYTTLEEYLESQRSLGSPTLQRSVPDFYSLSTPPPLVDAPDDYEASCPDSVVLENPSTIEFHVPRIKPQPSEYDALLIRQLGPSYPEDIAERAGAELPIDSPESPCEDRPLHGAFELAPMIPSPQDVYSSHQQQGVAIALRAPLRASEKLNDAISPSHATIPQSAYPHHGMISVSDRYIIPNADSKTGVRVSIEQLTSDDARDVLQVSNLSIQSSPVGTKLTTLPPGSRPELTTLNVTTLNVQQQHHRHDSITDSPNLAKFTITPSDGHPSQTLPRLQGHPSPTNSTGYTLDSKQTLPSLQTALNSATDSNGTPYFDASPALHRPSPSQTTQYGLSPAAHTHSNPGKTMSPPRFSSNPASWRTLSNNSSNSGTSEFTSGQTSGTSSTPGTRPSPSQSVSTPLSQHAESEHESNPDFDVTSSNHQTNTQLSLGLQSGYQCPFPGCMAAPFQTQYLLNSHTNVHSNQRPHFCPVEGCPRGPGGQGFKRKNEMIRHGLVHQSPGYVCPFCPDQQHRYPRPDNLQRHVRVHHMDKDKDDPLLRDVLAQRPEGGHRGRRRRMM